MDAEDITRKIGPVLYAHLAEFEKIIDDCVQKMDGLNEKLICLVQFRSAMEFHLERFRILFDEIENKKERQELIKGFDDLIEFECRKARMIYRTRAIEQEKNHVGRNR